MKEDVRILALARHDYIQPSRSILTNTIQDNHLMSQPTDEADKSTGNAQVTHESINFANFNQDSTCVSVGYQS
ncbi:hypothetical protein, partial [Mycobacterium tuberculosis]|uniref:hypothetical protein n=1 Tax=Mycobacterium tuberculosis TaxID=1773 RepID=UPI00254F8EBB